MCFLKSVDNYQKSSLVLASHDVHKVVSKPGILHIINHAIIFSCDLNE